jgi:hypothetical protein
VLARCDVEYNEIYMIDSTNVINYLTKCLGWSWGVQAKKASQFLVESVVIGAVFLGYKL